MILNALHGDSLPVYGDGMQVRNWIHATDFARAIGHVLEHGVPGEVYNAGGPDEERQHRRSCERIIELTGADRVADRARHRPSRPRPPLLALLGEGPRARLGAAGALRGGPAGDRRLVPRERLVVGADPLRRLPRVLRAPVRPRSELSSPQLRDLPGAVFLDERDVRELGFAGVGALHFGGGARRAVELDFLDRRLRGCRPGRAVLSAPACSRPGPSAGARSRCSRAGSVQIFCASPAVP